ncbi:MAG TPA: cryptochrome/photolyase family protein [Pelobium sp.]
MAKTLRLILGDQLNLQHSWFKNTDKHHVYLMMEVMQEQEYVKHHIQKIIGFFLAMRSFAEELEKAGHEVIYLKLDDAKNLQSFEKNIQQIIKEIGAEKLEYQLPDEYRLDEQLKKICSALPIETSFVDTEHFFTERFDVREFFKGKKQYLMETFYRDMRKKHHVLVDERLEPFGDKWNFDHDNRKKYDGKVPLKGPLQFKKDVTQLIDLIDKMKVGYFGKIDARSFTYPTNRAEALKVLEYFCEELLPAFGRYEDAMLKEHHTLFHSQLSFALNLKMLSPHEVLKKVLTTWGSRKSEINIAQVEGFVRQVIGWREYIRGIYWDQMPAFADKNFLNNKTDLPSWFWDGKVKMNCMKYCINNSLENAYAHHIQRLMVIGNFALLIGADPKQVDEWYLGVYIDAVEWVQITNTRGMSQFADGGLIGSKPYVASANYINKMSNYCKGCYYDKDKRYGEKACPFNSLYWNFYLQHQNKLKKNPRIGMMYRLVEKMDKTEITAILKQADIYLSQLNTL